MTKVFYWIKVVFYEIYYTTKKKLKVRGKTQRTEIDRINNTFEFMERRKWIYYKRMIRKYPELSWAKKYVQAGKSLVVKGIVAQVMKETMNFNTIWTYEGNFEICRYILSLGVSFVSEIFINGDTPHSILIRKYKEDKDELLFGDSLGNFNSNYKFSYNENCYISRSKFLQINTGNEIMISICMPSNDYRFQTIKKRIRGHKYYEFP